MSQNNQMPKACAENGPFCILTSGRDNGTITSQNAEGNTWNSSLSTGPTQEPARQTISRQISLPTPIPDTTTVTAHHPTPLNRFVILQHRDDTYSSNQMDIDTPLQNSA